MNARNDGLFVFATDDFCLPIGPKIKGFIHGWLHRDLDEAANLRRIEVTIDDVANHNIITISIENEAADPLVRINDRFDGVDST